MYASLRLASGRLRRRCRRSKDSAERLTVIAHRGASHLAPENTLAAVELAWHLRADAVEVDVRLTRDGRIVVIHDETTDRTAGTHLEVAATDSSQLRQLDVGCHKHPKFAGQRIPYLEEVLQTVPPGRQLFVEIKCGPEILPPLVETIAGSGKRSQVVTIGFDLDTVRAAKSALPETLACWLCDKRVLVSYERSLADQAKAGGIDGLDVHWTGVTRRFIRAVKAAGLRLYVWTVDDPAQALHLAAMGADGITTNRPGRLRNRMEPPAHMFGAKGPTRRAAALRARTGEKG
jgi:glycerophosphoryl diester phosphodiesterase